MTTPEVPAALAPAQSPAPAPADLCLNGHGEGLAVSTAMFWETRPVLHHIRAYALALWVSPWAVLGVTLARVLAATPPHIVLPPFVGGPGSLNSFIGLVGSPAAGKGGAASAGDAAVRLGQGTHRFTTHKLGTGQGIAHAYARRERNGDLTQHTQSVMFVCEEVDALTATSRQLGSLLLPELRSLYMGERLGAMYVDPTKRMEVAAHAYRATLVVHIQPERAGGLLDDAHAGLPQRFVWLPTDYPHERLPPGPPATPWHWAAPDWPREQPNQPTKQHIMPVADVIRDEIYEARWLRSRGEGDPLDGHRLFTQEKLAAGLAILDGRNAVSDADWELAKTVMAVSDTTRDGVIKALESVKVRANQAKGTAEAIRAVAVDDARDDAAIKRVIRVLARHTPPHPEWISRKALRGKVNSRDRCYVDDAVDRLLGTGQLIYERVGTGVRYRRGAPQ